MVTKIEEQIDGQETVKRTTENADKGNNDGVVNGEKSLLSKPNEIDTSMKDKTPSENQDDKQEDGEDPNQSKSSCIYLKYKIKMMLNMFFIVIALHSSINNEDMKSLIEFKLLISSKSMPKSIKILNLSVFGLISVLVVLCCINFYFFIIIC